MRWRRVPSMLVCLPPHRPTYVPAQRPLFVTNARAGTVFVAAFTITPKNMFTKFRAAQSVPGTRRYSKM